MSDDIETLDRLTDEERELNTALDLEREQADAEGESAPLAVLTHHLGRAEDFIAQAQYGDALGVLAMLKKGMPGFAIGFKDDIEGADLEREEATTPAKLLPCPFCGEADTLDLNDDSASDPQRPQARIYNVCCGHCGAEGPAESSALTATQRWNKPGRASDQMPEGIRRALQDMGARVFAALEIIDLVRNQIDTGSCALEGVRQILEPVTEIGDDLALRRLAAERGVANLNL